LNARVNQGEIPLRIDQRAGQNFGIFLYSLLHLKCQSILISNFNLLGLFSPERGKRDLLNQIIKEFLYYVATRFASSQDVSRFHTKINYFCTSQFLDSVYHRHQKKAPRSQIWWQEDRSRVHRHSRLQRRQPSQPSWGK